ncbi:MAG: hypothetical protein AAF978_10540, partial [Cyanobacteria bacterium P01_E01_bin.48]
LSSEPLASVVFKRMQKEPVSIAQQRFGVVTVYGDILRFFVATDDLLIFDQSIKLRSQTASSSWRDILNSAREETNVTQLFVDPMIETLQLPSRIEPFLSDIFAAFPSAEYILSDRHKTCDLMLRSQCDLRPTVAIRRTQIDFEMVQADWYLPSCEAPYATRTASMASMPQPDIAALSAERLNRVSDWLASDVKSQLRSIYEAPEDVLTPLRADIVQWAEAFAVVMQLDTLLTDDQSTSQLLQVNVSAGHWSSDTPGLLAMYRPNDRVVVVPSHHNDAYCNTLKKLNAQNKLQPSIIQPAAYMKRAWELRAAWRSLYEATT